MASRDRLRPSPPPRGPALVRPVVGALLLTLGGSVGAGCVKKGGSGDSVPPMPDPTYGDPPPMPPPDDDPVPPMPPPDEDPEPDPVPPMPEPG